MADNNGPSVTPFLAFIVGALIVTVVVLGFFMYTGGHFGTNNPSQVAVNIHAPKVPSPTKPPG